MPVSFIFLKQPIRNFIIKSSQAIRFFKIVPILSVEVSFATLCISYHVFLFGVILGFLVTFFFYGVVLCFILRVILLCWYFFEKTLVETFALLLLSVQLIGQCSEKCCSRCVPIKNKEHMSQTCEKTTKGNNKKRN